MSTDQDGKMAEGEKANGDSKTDEQEQASVVDESEMSPEEKSLHYKQLGNDALMAGHYNDAVGHYTDAVDAMGNAPVFCNRALAYIKLENYGLAIADAEAAIEIDATFAKSYYRKGTAYFALNKLKLARKDFRQVCKLKPKDKDARGKLQACEKAIKEQAFANAIQSTQSSPLSETYEPSNLHLGNYDGPQPLVEDQANMELEVAAFRPGQLPRKFVLDALDWMKDQKQLHKRFVARLLLSCLQYFKYQPTLMDIRLPTEPPPQGGSPRVTVCGDTHGQFYDVLNIFQINGYPASNNPYLFNGDFVDRGSFSVEVILALLLFKISDPSSIYLTRGNHETKNMNRIYGFEGEVKAKYDEQIFDLFLEVFGFLPLAATIQDKIFITHGGLPSTAGVTLQNVREIKRGGEPPESGLASDLLWSDPQPFPGRSPSKRGVGFSFGPDITEAFLQENQLNLLVRSHEVKQEGYLVEHGGKTITVFSAPNYCDSMGNKGAFIHFDESLEPKFTQYDAVPHPNIKPMQYAAGMGGLFA